MTLQIRQHIIVFTLLFVIMFLIAKYPRIFSGENLNINSNELIFMAIQSALATALIAYSRAGYSVFWKNISSWWKPRE
jgi:hypothetical protein